MRVLQVCAEMYPLLKTGGLADVTGALPAALAPLGVEVRPLLPGYREVMAALQEPAVVGTLGEHGRVPGARLLFGPLQGTGASGYVIDAPDLFQRSGGPYADAYGQPYSDNHLRFARLGWAAAELAAGFDGLWQPQVIHAHDWHAGLTPACVMALGQTTPTVYTIHNLAYQGQFTARQFDDLALPRRFFDMHGVEFHGALNFMKAGLFFAQQLTTVSPSYAEEIQAPQQGMGLDGLLRSRAAELTGILNGVDGRIWNPACDEHIAKRYSARNLRGGKGACKIAWQRKAGLDDTADAPLFVVVSRLTEQKGLPLLLRALPTLVERGAQFSLIGTGDAWLEEAFQAEAAKHPGRVAVHIGYDEAMAHQQIAAGDVIAVPSLFEPCGLTQLYGLAYGTLPLVRRVGGLADTVTDCALENLDTTATGFVFDAMTDEALDAAIRRALALYRRPSEWRAIQRRAMAERHDWADVAPRYARLYAQLA